MFCEVCVRESGRPVHDNHHMTFFESAVVEVFPSMCGVAIREGAWCAQPLYFLGGRRRHLS